jgi:hypothetical protein
MEACSYPLEGKRKQFPREDQNDFSLEGRWKLFPSGGKMKGSSSTGKMEAFSL